MREVGLRVLCCMRPMISSCTCGNDVVESEKDLLDKNAVPFELKDEEGVTEGVNRCLNELKDMASCSSRMSVASNT